MSVLCVGEALIDMICTDRGVPLSEGTHFLVKPGGAPTNVAAVIAAMGGKVTLSAKVGSDAFGTRLVRVMRDFGVDTQWLLQSQGSFTTLAFVSLLENGERDFLFNRGADGELTAAETDAIELTDISVIHFGSATAFLPGPLNSAYTHLFQKAKQREVLISFDPNYRQLLFRDNLAAFIKQSWPFLQASHFCKLSDEEAMLLTGTSSVTAAAGVLLAKTDAVFAITLGSEGALLGFNNTLIPVPGISINPVDTTGAGDAFTAAVLYQLSGKTIGEFYALERNDWVRIISNANKTGARACEYLGAMEGFINLGEPLF